MIILKRITPFLILILILAVIGSSGCTQTEQRQSLYQGQWSILCDHFLMSHAELDALFGSYTAYKNNDSSISFEGKGKQNTAWMKMSMQPQQIYDKTQGPSYDIKITYVQQGNDVNATYFLNGTAQTYEMFKNMSVDKAADLMRKFWEQSLNNAEETEYNKTLGNSEIIKL